MSSVLPPSSSRSSVTDKDASTTSTPSPRIPSILGFDGLAKECCSPPDVQVAAGPNDIVEMVNLKAGIFSNVGSGDEFELSEIFNVTADDELSDPEIIYDSGSGRYFAIILDTTTNSILLAVSKSENFIEWNDYIIPFRNCPDNPSIGVSDDKFAISANDYSNHCEPGGSFQGVEYYIIDKFDLVNGLPFSYVKQLPDRSIFSLVPVHNLTPDSTLYMATNQDPFLQGSSIIKLLLPINNYSWSNLRYLPDR